MQLLIILIIVIMICFILGVSINYMLTGAYILLCITAAAFTLGFIVCFIQMLFSRRVKATYTRMAPLKGTKKEAACYMADGKEYICMFPAESLLSQSLYQQDKTCSILVHSKTGRALDRYASITCVVGLLFSISLDVLLLLIIM